MQKLFCKLNFCHQKKKGKQNALPDVNNRESFPIWLWKKVVSPRTKHSKGWKQRQTVDFHCLFFSRLMGLQRIFVVSLLKVSLKKKKIASKRRSSKLLSWNPFLFWRSCFLANWTTRTLRQKNLLMLDCFTKWRNF